MNTTNAAIIRTTTIATGDRMCTLTLDHDGAMFTLNGWRNVDAKVLRSYVVELAGDGDGSLGYAVEVTARADRAMRATVSA